MIGAIIGDIVGSPYEGSMLNWVDDKNFPLFANEFSRFTDDTILTCATAEALLKIGDNRREDNIEPLIPIDKIFAEKYIEWNLKYPGRGYGSGFQQWVDDGGIKSNLSFANGCMMRCSPIPLFFTDLDNIYKAALDSIKMTHNSAESERGIFSIVSAIHIALNGGEKAQIKEFVEEQCGHMLDLTVEQWREHPKTSIRCNLSAPQSLVCFMESTDYESAIRNAVYTKGDTDTTAAIAGSIAEAFYGVKSIPQEMIDGAKARMTPEMIELVNKFYSQVGGYQEKCKGFQI